MTTVTNQTVSINSKEGKSLLRKIVRHPLAAFRDGEWHLRANDATEWHVEFWRRVPGEIGEPDRTVTVSTDAVVCLEGRTGSVKPFDDAAVVTVPQCRYVHLWGSDCATAARLLLDGWRLVACHSSGSTSSSLHGLAFIRLQAEKRDTHHWATVGIGTETVFVNGTRVIVGACT
jgi:hypothetical protein